jgi:hypothetical protein
MRKKIDLLNKKFGRLLVIAVAPTKKGRAVWRCKCDCDGNEQNYDGAHLRSGHTKSCGCLHWNISSTNNDDKIYSPYISSARQCWKNYLYRDKKCSLAFEEWFNFSQQNCFYCGIKPYNVFNYFLSRKNASQFAKENGNFTYNGLDRINSLKNYTIDNCAPCCLKCNIAKRERSVEDFLKHINSIQINVGTIFVPPTQLLDLPEKLLRTSINEVYEHYITAYGKMEIDKQTFYTLSQLPCHYCNIASSNHYNPYICNKGVIKLSGKDIPRSSIDKCHYHYNGIDRIDSSKDHSIENIVPCCKWCNIAKHDMTLVEFYDWVDRLQKYQLLNSSSDIF